MKQRGFGRAAAALAAGVALLAGEGALSGAAAQTKTAVTANELEAILTDAGLSPTMAEDAASGSPVAAGRLGDNIIFWVRALDCAGGPKACETLMFFVNFELGRPMTPKDYAVINSYNESQVFGRDFGAGGNSALILGDNRAGPGRRRLCRRAWRRRHDGSHHAIRQSLG